MNSSERRLEFRNYFQDNLEKRMVKDKIVKIIVIACVIIAIIPLGSILADVVRMGIEIISFEFLTALQVQQVREKGELQTQFKAHS